MREGVGRSSGEDQCNPSNWLTDVYLAQSGHIWGHFHTLFGTALATLPSLSPGRHSRHSRWADVSGVIKWSSSVCQLLMITGGNLGGRKDTHSRRTTRCPVLRVRHCVTLADVLGERKPAAVIKSTQYNIVWQLPKLCPNEQLRRGWKE